MSILQIVVKARLGTSTELRNIHHYDFLSYVPDLTQTQEAVDAIDDAYYTHLRGLFNDQVVVYEYDVRRVDVGDQPTLTVESTRGNWSATGAAENLPSILAALCTFKAFTTFPRTARTYLFPMTEGQNSASGDLEPTTVEAIEDWADDMMTLDITGAADADKVTVAYGGEPRIVIINHSLTSKTVNPRWSTMRSRRGGVGI